jgi:hypothetical protein
MSLRLALALLAVSLFFAPAASAQVTITVEGLVGALPDTDGLLEGDTDGYVRVFVEGNFVGQTPVVADDNTPIWPGSFSILLVLDANTTPTATIDLQVYDEDSGTDEFLGTATYEYDWVNGATVSTTVPFSGPLGSGEIGVRVSSELDPVDNDESSWSGVKARFTE